jgi:site-specific DNA-methyltransferase (adenine-specific)
MPINWRNEPTAMVASGGFLLHLMDTNDRRYHDSLRSTTKRELEYSSSSSWGIFRRPIPDGMTVGNCLDKFQTGGLRRKPDGSPFQDVIKSERTPQKEREIADHPSLKPQSFLRQIVYASLPLGEGIVLDPFMGSGSTVAAAEALGYSCIGIERQEEFYALSHQAVRALARLNTSEAQLSLSLI